MNIAQDREITAILPRYTGKGDSTVIVDANGEEMLYPVGQGAILARVAGRCCKDIHLLRAWARGYTGQRLWMPLGFSWELVLVPMRIREAKIKGDATLGYFNFVHIKDVREAEDRVSVIMENGLEFPMLWGISTVKKHLKDAMLLHSMLTHNLDDTLWLRLHKAAGLSRAVCRNGIMSWGRGC